MLRSREESVAIAREHFDYDGLAAKLSEKIRGLVRSNGGSLREFPAPAIAESAREVGSIPCREKACTKTQ
jgi:hypothetical protein